MNTCHQSSTLTSSDACFTPNEGSNALPRKTGWSSSTVEIDRSSKRLSSVENSGQYFKRQKTPSSCPATNNEHVFTSGRRPSATESERDEEEGMNANDVVNQRGNVVGIGDDSPSALDVKRVLSVVWSKGNLGSSYYDTETSQLYLQMDVVETNDFQFLKRVKEQVQASVIITSVIQDERLLKILNGQEGENNDEQICQTTEVEILPSIDFSYEVCKRRITALNACLPGIPQHFTENEREIHMSSLVPFDNISMVRSAGALIKYIDKKRVGVEMDDPEVRVPILGLKVFSLSDLLIVDNNTYSALQIFQKESHPSVYKMGAGNSGAKEGLSLFERCRMQLNTDFKQKDLENEDSKRRPANEDTKTKTRKQRPENEDTKTKTRKRRPENEDTKTKTRKRRPENEDPLFSFPIIIMDAIYAKCL